jgi:muramidase (phage lysozyme)
MDTKLKAFLDLIAFSEGTSTSSITKNNGYDIIVSGIYGPSIFTDYSDHPFAHGGSIIVRNSPLLISTASGRYQILAHYFEVYKKQLNLSDFSPSSQDTVALQMMKEHKAVSLVLTNNIEQAITACSNIWASFPGNNYNQGGYTLATLVAKYNELLNI